MKNCKCKIDNNVINFFRKDLNSNEILFSMNIACFDAKVITSITTINDDEFVLTINIDYSALEIDYSKLLPISISASIYRVEVDDLTSMEQKQTGWIWGAEHFTVGHTFSCGDMFIFFSLNGLPDKDKISYIDLMPNLYRYKKAERQVRIYCSNADKGPYISSFDEGPIDGFIDYMFDVTDALHFGYEGCEFEPVTNDHDNYLVFHSYDLGVYYIILQTNQVRDFKKFNAGKAGEGYVELFTGDLYFTHNDLSYDSTINPFQINHIYNIENFNNMQSFDNNIMKVGNGWKLNFIQTITRLDDYNGNAYVYSYVDGKGIEHNLLKRYYVYKDMEVADGSIKSIKKYLDDGKTSLNWEYADSEGLVFDFSKNILIDSFNNKFYFEKKMYNQYYLTAFENSSGIKYFIIDYENNLIKVSDLVNNKEINLAIGNDLYLQSIELKHESKTIDFIQFQYESENLVKIIYKNNKCTEFEYKDNLCNIIDQTGLNTVIEYGSKNYVSTIKNYYDSNLKINSSLTNYNISNRNPKLFELYDIKYNKNDNILNYTEITDINNFRTKYCFDLTYQIFNQIETDNNSNILNYNYKNYIQINKEGSNSSNDEYEIIEANINLDDSKVEVNFVQDGYNKICTIDNFVNMEGYYSLFGEINSNFSGLSKPWENKTKFCELIVIFSYTNGSEKTIRLDFKEGLNFEQFAILPFFITKSDEKNLKTIQIGIRSSFEINIEKLLLYKKHNNRYIIIKENNLFIQENLYNTFKIDITKYDDVDKKIQKQLTLNSESGESREKYSYFDINTINEVLNCEHGLSKKYQYDINNRKTKIEENIITSNYTFVTDIKYLENETIISDSNERKTIIDFDGNTGLKIKENNKNYLYDEEKNLICKYVDGLNDKATYKYSLGYLTEVVTNNVKFNYEYDGIGRVTSIKINDKDYLTFKYFEGQNVDNISGAICKIIKIYNDGKYNIMYFNNRYRLIYESNQENNPIIYKYDNKNQLISKSDSNDSLSYFRDEYNRISNVSSNSNNIDFEYDFYDRVISKTYNKNHKYRLLYKNNIDKLISSLTLPNNVNIKYQYDDLQRLVSANNGLISNKINYGENSHLIKENIISYKDKRYVFEYEYDENGNISKEDGGTAIYEYDQLNRLIHENNLSKNYYYVYDENGNIQEIKSDFDRTEINFSYDPNYKDRLVAIYGWPIDYKNNYPINWLFKNSNDEYSMKSLEWDNKGRLKSIDNGKIVYEYNLDSIRKTKIVNGKKTEYFLEGIR